MEITTPPIVNGDSFNLEQALKQFSLETERLEMTYRNLQDRFQSVQTTLQESHTRLSGKLAELDFLSRYLETILNHISQGIIFIDMQGIVTTFNAAAELILKHPQKEILFHPFTKYFRDDFFGFSLKEAFATKNCLKSGFIAWKRGEGETVELEIEATFVAMSQQAFPLAHREAASPPIQGLLILVRNITEMRRLQQMASRNDRLKELGEMAAHLAHEIRNPLGGIKGFANLLQQELEGKKDLQQMATYIVQGTDDLNAFVSNVLMYARPFQLHIENVDLMLLIEELKHLIQADPKWNEKIEFIVQSPCANLIVPLDPQLFKTALLNLWVNAVQAMPNGGVLKMAIRPESSWVIIQVEDTGEGIAAENLSKIFTPLFTTKEAGNGLGLAEVQKVIEAHQGWIEVNSEVGKGTLFTIKIPLKIGE